MYERLQSEYTAATSTRDAKKHSCWGIGKTTPDPAETGLPFSVVAVHCAVLWVTDSALPLAMCSDDGGWGRSAAGEGIVQPQGQRRLPALR